MRVIIDTNIIIASMIKDGVTRSILFKDNLQILTPDYTLEELNEHEKEIKEKANLSSHDFNLLKEILFSNITIIPKYEYVGFIPIASKLIKDEEDVPFIALALSTNADLIWSEDKHFKSQKSVKVFTTKELLAIFNQNL